MAYMVFETTIFEQFRHARTRMHARDLRPISCDACTSMLIARPPGAHPHRCSARQGQRAAAPRSTPAQPACTRQVRPPQLHTQAPSSPFPNPQPCCVHSGEKQRAVRCSSAGPVAWASFGVGGGIQGGSVGTSPAACPVRYRN